MKKLVLSIFLIAVLFLLETSDLLAQASFDTGTLGVSIGTYGRVRLLTPDNLGKRQVERISILVGKSENEVFDYQNDVDVEVPTVLVTSPQNSDFEIYGEYNNAYSGAAPDILEKLTVLGWNNASYVLLKFTAVNRETSAFDAIVGCDIIPFVDSLYGFDTVSYDLTNNIIRSHRGETNVGYKLLSHPLASMTAFEWYDGYEVDASYWGWLNHGTIDPQYVSNTADGPVIITSQAPQNLTSGDSLTFYFAVAIGVDQTEMLANMQLAQQKYFQIVSVESDLNNIPKNFTLDQNYPNPFNPSTKISFGLPQRSNVVLKIFSTLGEQVAELVNESLDAGTHTYNFDASKITSGVYIYSLQTDAGVISKKMTLIK
ncbi:MAG: T9SS type A sorting domain-containing protein [Ignavibacteriales bacterium]|nr:T9SS type A sorting domain-containing protein [Ignavibacteriales bacterium]